MELTQKAAFADLQGYLGLTSTELPDATATLLLNEGFNKMFTSFSKEGYFYDESDTKKEQIQKEAEIRIAASFYMARYAPQKLLNDFETYDLPLAHDINISGFKLGEKGGAKRELNEWYREMAKIYQNEFEKKIYILLQGETVPEIKSSYL